MRLDLTKPELDAILDALNGQPLKCQKKLREQLIQRLYWMLHPSKAPDNGGWAPIKGHWPSGLVKADPKSHWSFHSPKGNPTKQPTKKATADDILAELAL